MNRLSDHWLGHSLILFALIDGFSENANHPEAATIGSRKLTRQQIRHLPKLERDFHELWECLSCKGGVRHTFSLSKARSPTRPSIQPRKRKDLVAWRFEHSALRSRGVASSGRF